MAWTLALWGHPCPQEGSAVGEASVARGPQGMALDQTRLRQALEGWSLLRHRHSC